MSQRRAKTSYRRQLNAKVPQCGEYLQYARQIGTYPRTYSLWTMDYERQYGPIQMKRVCTYPGKLAE
jgi:hypothetical protein